MLAQGQILVSVNGSFEAPNGVVFEQPGGFEGEMFAGTPPAQTEDGSRTQTRDPKQRGTSLIRRRAPLAPHRRIIEGATVVLGRGSAPCERGTPVVLCHAGECKESCQRVSACDVSLK